jgi:outer membrane receptor protein involved in Fe transport
MVHPSIADSHVLFVANATVGRTYRPETDALGGSMQMILERNPGLRVRALVSESLGIVLLLMMSICLIPGVARAQNSNTGEIKGEVTDPSSAVVPGVSVAIKDVDTGVVTKATTNGAGIYDVPFLAPGSYSITFSKQGFRDYVRSGITLQINTVEVDAALQVGTTTAEVVVNGEASLVETQTSGQHVDLSTSAISAAPIVGTDWRAELTQLMPGVNNGGGTGAANGQGVGVNGTQGYNINFLSDGSSATAPRDFNSSNFYPPIDTIDEVSINSGNAPAQYGNGLASVNVITKSGTNRFHGSGFEYLQNTSLNARGFYNKTGPKAVEHWNDYGGTIGGPVIKDKLFFFFSYQRNPSSAPTGGTYTYPTAAMEAGDFYGMQGSTGSAFDSNGNLLATPDPVALKLQSYFPGASAPGWVTGCPGPVNASSSVAQTCPTTNNYIFSGTSPNTATWYTGKTDYNISQAQKLSFSFNYFPTFVSYVPADPLYPNDATSYSAGNNYDLTGQLTDVYTFSSNVLNEFRVGASRELDKYVPPSLGKNDPATIGLEPAYGTNAPANVFPKITVDEGADTGCIALGAGCGENGNIDAVLGEGVYNVSDVLTLVRGKHTIKVGGEYDRNYQDYTSWGDISSGNFEFNGSVTGIPYADFLAGDVYGWYVYEYDPTSAHSWNGALFASDDYKVTPHLTLNLGLRYQLQSGWGVAFNAFGNYDPFLPNTANGGLYHGAILFGGQSDTVYGGPISSLKTIQNGDYREFAPRVGLAWSPREKWVIRASYGLFDAPRDAENYTDGALGLGFNPHNQGNGGYVNGSSAFPLSVGPPAGTVVFPTLQTLSPEIDNYSGFIEYYPQNMPTVYVQQWLFSVQHEFAGNMLLDTSYVYTRGTNQNFATDINQAPAAQLGCTGYNCGNPNPIFNSILAQIYDGWSNYNALQLRLQKRMSNGLNFQFNYAWSKSLDTGTGNGHGSGVDIYQNAYSPLLNYGLSDFNAANTFVGQVAYQLPFGHGRHFELNGPADEIAGGWQVSTLFQWHGGTPFTPVIQSSVADGIDPGLAPSFSAGSTLYPDQVASPHVSSPGPGGWFNPSAYANPAYGTFGTVGRNTLIGPGFSDVDFSVAKVFPLHFEGVSLEIRADMYDVFNHLNYANPDGDVASSATACAANTPDAGMNLADCYAGTISNSAGYSALRRVIQLGAHIRF